MTGTFDSAKVRAGTEMHRFLRIAQLFENKGRGRAKWQRGRIAKKSHGIDRERGFLVVFGYFPDGAVPFIGRARNFNVC